MAFALGNLQTNLQYVNTALVINIFTNFKRRFANHVQIYNRHSENIFDWVNNLDNLIVIVRYGSDSAFTSIMAEYQRKMSKITEFVSCMTTLTKNASMRTQLLMVSLVANLCLFAVSPFVVELVGLGMILVLILASQGHFDGLTKKVNSDKGAKLHPHRDSASGNPRRRRSKCHVYPSNIADLLAHAQAASDEVLLFAFPELLKQLRRDTSMTPQEQLDAFVSSNYREMLSRLVVLTKNDRVQDMRVINAAVDSFGCLCQFSVRTKADWDFLEVDMQTIVKYFYESNIFIFNDIII